MLKLLLRKWWVLLLQGLLLIALSIYIFNHPVAVLAGISLWFGIFIFATGLLGTLEWLFADATEREGMSLLWSILSAAFGLLLIFNLLATMVTLTIIFGLWMLLTGVRVTLSGWAVKNNNSMGWIMVFAGLLSAVVAVMVLFNLGVGAVGISILLGLHVLFSGIGLVLLALAKKAVRGRVKDAVQNLKSNG